MTLQPVNLSRTVSWVVFMTDELGASRNFPICDLHLYRSDNKDGEYMCFHYKKHVKVFHDQAWDEYFQKYSNTNTFHFHEYEYEYEYISFKSIRIQIRILFEKYSNTFTNTFMNTF